MEADFTDGVLANATNATTPSSSTPKNDSAPLASLHSHLHPCEHNEQIVTQASNSELNKSIDNPKTKSTSKSRGIKDCILESHRGLFQDRVPQVCPVCENKPVWNRTTRIKHEPLLSMVTYDNEKSQHSQQQHLLKKNSYSKQDVLNSPQRKIISLKNTKLKNHATPEETQSTQISQSPQDCPHKIPEKSSEKVTPVFVEPMGEKNTEQEATKINFFEVKASPPISSSSSSSLNEVSHPSTDNQCYSRSSSGTNYDPNAKVVSRSQGQVLDRNRVSNSNSILIGKTPVPKDHEPISSDTNILEDETSEAQSHSIGDSRTEGKTELSRERQKENVCISKERVQLDSLKEEQKITCSLGDEMNRQFPQIAETREVLEQLYHAPDECMKEELDGSLLTPSEIKETPSEASLSYDEVIEENTAYFSKNDLKTLSSYDSIERSSKSHNMTSVYSENTFKSTTESKVTELSYKISHVILEEKTNENHSRHSTEPMKSDDSKEISVRQYQAYNITFMNEVSESQPDSFEKSHAISSTKSKEQTDVLTENYNIVSTKIKHSMSSLNPSEILERGVMTVKKTGNMKCCSDTAIIKENHSMSNSVSEKATTPRAKSTTIIDIISHSLSNNPSSNSSMPESSPLDSVSYYNSSWTNSYTENVTESAV